MNLYLLVEGRRTEKKLYPAWLSFALPILQRVLKPEDAANNNYYIVSGGGFPDIKNHTAKAIDTINTLDALYTHFVIVLDSDGCSPTDTEREIMGVVNRTPLLRNVQVTVIVQHSCIETWLLGNQKICSQKTTSKELQACRAFYDVRLNDPELMTKPKDTAGTIADYHEYYLKRVLRDRPSKALAYNKTNPGVTCDKSYWNALVARHQALGHMTNFGRLLQLLALLETAILPPNPTASITRH